MRTLFTALVSALVVAAASASTAAASSSSGADVRGVGGGWVGFLDAYVEPPDVQDGNLVIDLG